MNNISYLDEILKSRTLNDFQRTALQVVLKYLLKQTFADRENCILDIFNEAYIKIAQAKTFDSSKQVAPWAYKVAMSAMCNYFNRENRYRSILVDLSSCGSYDDDWSACPCSADGWEQQTIGEETLAAFHKCYGALSGLDRRIVELKESGLKVKEIAALLQLSSNAVALHLFRLRKVLSEFRSVA